MQRVLLDVRPEHLALPTPCAQWTVRELLAHQLGQELGMSAALSGGARDVADWVPVDGGEPVAEVLTQALMRTDAVLAELGEIDGRELWMPEIRPTAALPATFAIGAHLLDLAVHAWDIGVAVGRPPRLDDELMGAVLDVARAIPNTARGADGPFEGEVASVEGDDDFAVALRLCGRDPDWQPPSPADTTAR